MKALPIEQIYADPHALDPYLDSGEAIRVMRDGQTVAQFVPCRENDPEIERTMPRGIDYRARFLAMWGPAAFESTVSVDDEFAELRQGRDL